ncbi:hypothetical protein A2U01_0080587, partial [Trifolium medium]|nr:hypothetical protein [Trifolium medium]
GKVEQEPEHVSLNSLKELKEELVSQKGQHATLAAQVKVMAEDQRVVKESQVKLESKIDYVDASLKNLLAFFQNNPNFNNS